MSCAINVLTQVSAQDQLAQSRLERKTASIDLFKALGGGWIPPDAMASVSR